VGAYRQSNQATMDNLYNQASYDSLMTDDAVEPQPTLWTGPMIIPGGAVPNITCAPTILPGTTIGTVTVNPPKR